MLQMLIKDLKLAPMRTMLTSLSMLIGILAIIISVLVGTFGRAYLVGTNEQLSGRTPTYKIGISSPNITNSTLFAAFIERLHTPKADIGLVVDSNSNLAFASSPKIVNNDTEYNTLLRNTHNTDVIYTTPSYANIYRLPIMEGRWFNNTTITTLEAVSNIPASRLFPVHSFAYANGKDSLDMTPIPIVGTVNDGNTQPMLYLNIVGILKFAPYLLHSDNATVLWHDTTVYTTDAQKISFINDQLTDTIGGKTNSFNQSDLGKSYESVINIVQLSFFITAILLLFVSMIGLANIGLSTLEQRSHELVIRRALGASRMSIAMLVLNSSILLAIVTSTIAILFSIIIVQCLPLLIPKGSPIDIPAYPYMAALGAVIAATTTAILGSLLPAIRAARLEPADVLR